MVLGPVLNIYCSSWHPTSSSVSIVAGVSRYIREALRRAIECKIAYGVESRKIRAGAMIPVHAVYLNAPTLVYFRSPLLQPTHPVRANPRGGQFKVTSCQHAHKPTGIHLRSFYSGSSPRRHIFHSSSFSCTEYALRHIKVTLSAGSYDYYLFYAIPYLVLSHLFFVADHVRHRKDNCDQDIALIGLRHSHRCDLVGQSYVHALGWRCDLKHRKLKMGLPCRISRDRT